MKLHILMVVVVGLLIAADTPAPVDGLARKAQADFNVLDRNGDGFLNRDEMPDDLKAELSKWDTNRDNLISLDEFKYYFGTQRQDRRDNNNNNNNNNNRPSNPVIIIVEEDDLDERPIVYRAGKLPTKELPKWFLDLDTDQDGQVALFEWHKGGKNLDEFREWDRNDDGYITAEEALYKQHSMQSGGGLAHYEGNFSAGASTMRSDKSFKMNYPSEERGRKGMKGYGFKKSNQKNQSPER